MLFLRTRTPAPRREINRDRKAQLCQSSSRAIAPPPTSPNSPASTAPQPGNAPEQWSLHAREASVSFADNRPIGADRSRASREVDARAGSGSRQSARSFAACSRTPALSLGLLVGADSESSLESFPVTREDVRKCPLLENAQRFSEVPYALATTSRTSALSNVTPSGTFAPTRSAAVRAASSDSKTIIDRPLLPSLDRVQ
jgi:hypothetical protein